MRTITEVQNKEDNIEELAENDVHASYPLTDKAYYVEEIHFKLEDSICFNVAD